MVGLAELSKVFLFAYNQLKCPLTYRGSRRDGASLPHALLILSEAAVNLSPQGNSFRRPKRDTKGSLRPKFITRTPCPFFSL